MYLLINLFYSVEFDQNVEHCWRIVKFTQPEGSETPPLRDRVLEFMGRRVARLGVTTAEIRGNVILTGENFKSVLNRILQIVQTLVAEGAVVSSQCQGGQNVYLLKSNRFQKLRRGDKAFKVYYHNCGRGLKHVLFRGQFEILQLRLGGRLWSLVHAPRGIGAR